MIFKRRENRMEKDTKQKKDPPAVADESPSYLGNKGFALFKVLYQS